MAVQNHSTSIPAPTSNKPLVIVQTSEYGQQTGTLEFTCLSPFHGETIQRAFVVSLPDAPCFWTEYPTLEELVYVPAPQPENPEYELEDDPEYQQFLLDSEAAEMELERAEAVQMESAPALPVWAASSQIMVRGTDLQKGDTVYFSANANPRYLKREMGAGKWEVRTLASSFGFDKRIPGTCVMEAERWYVVKRPQPAYATAGN